MELLKEEIIFGGLTTADTDSGNIYGGGDKVKYPNQPLYATWMDGVRFDMNHGGIRPVYDNTLFNTNELSGGATQEIPSNIWDYGLNDGTHKLMLASYGSSAKRILYVPQGATAATALKTGLGTTAAYRAHFTTFMDLCVMMNGTDTPQVWDGTAAATWNIVTQAWYTGTALAVSQFGGVALALGAAEDIHIFGGTYSAGAGIKTYSSQHMKYDSMLKVWKTMKPAVKGFVYGGGAAILEKAYVFGGQNAAATACSTNEMWDDALETWTQKTSMTVAKMGFGSFTVNGKVYGAAGATVAGGPAYTDVATCYEYDPVANTWATKNPVNTARRLCGGYSLGTKGYTAGGVITATASAVHEEFDPLANTWTAKQSLTTARQEPGCADGYDNYGYIIGGWTTAGTPADSVKVTKYDPDLNTVSETLDLGTATKAVMAVRSGKMVWAVGGARAGVGTTASVYLNTSPVPPAGSMMAVYKNTLFFAGVGGFLSYLYWMDMGTIDSYDEHNNTLADSNTGDTIAGLFKYSDALHVLKRYCVYRVTGDIFVADPTESNYSTVYVSEHGTMWHDSIIMVENVMYWQGEDGFYKYTGGQPEKLARPYGSQAFLVINTSATYDLPAQTIVWTIIDTDQTGSIHWDLMYHLPSGRWSKTNNPYGGTPNTANNVLATCNFRDAVYGTLVLKATNAPASKTMYVWQAWGDANYAQTKKMSYTSWWFTPLQEPEKMVTIRKVVVIRSWPGNAVGDATITLYNDSGRSAALALPAGAAAVSETSRRLRVRIDTNLAGYHFYFNIVSTSAAQPIIERMIIYYEVEGGGRE